VFISAGLEGCDWRTPTFAGKAVEDATIDALVGVFEQNDYRGADVERASISTEQVRLFRRNTLGFSRVCSKNNTRIGF